MFVEAIITQHDCEVSGFQQKCQPSIDCSELPLSSDDGFRHSLGCVSSASVEACAAYTELTCCCCLALGLPSVNMLHAFILSQTCWHRKCVGCHVEPRGLHVERHALVLFSLPFLFGVHAA